MHDQQRIYKIIKFYLYTSEFLYTGQFLDHDNMVD